MHASTRSHLCAAALRAIAAVMVGAIASAATAGFADRAGSADDPLAPPWTIEDVVGLRVGAGLAQRPLTLFGSWTHPGLGLATFETFLAECGLPRTDAARSAPRAAWAAHRERMVRLHRTTADALWEGARRMEAEWERAPWSASVASLTQSQARRLADALLESIDDARELLSIMAIHAGAGRAERAGFAVVRTMDSMLRASPVVSVPRAGGARADLWELVQGARADLDAAADAQVRAALQRCFVAIEQPRRRLLRESLRVGLLKDHIRVPDEARLRAIKADLRSPVSRQALEAIRQAIEEAFGLVAPILGGEASARLRALLDDASAIASGTPHAAFPDPQRGEVACAVLAGTPPELPEDRKELLRAAVDLCCPEIRRINDSLRLLDWQEGVAIAEGSVEPAESERWLNRRRELVRDRARVNAELGDLLGIALDAETRRWLDDRLR